VLISIYDTASSFDNANILPALNVYLSSNTELIQTQKCCWINISVIKELCFIFFYCGVINGKFCCKGISNAYFIQYCYLSEERTLQDIESPYFAFPSYYPKFHLYWSSCFSTELWDSIVMLQQAITSFLCRYAQSQGQHPSSRIRVTLTSAVVCNIRAWLYMNNVMSTSFEISRMQKHVHNGIMYHKIRHRVKGYWWWFDTDTKLAVLSRLLGKNITVGVRVSAPKLGNPNNLHCNNSLNVVVPDIPGPNVDEKFQFCGIDLKYHSPYMDIYIRSSKFVVGIGNNPPTESLQQQLINVTDPVRAVVGSVRLPVGLRFQHGSYVYRIEQLLPGETVVGKCVYGARKGNEQLFDVATVMSAIVEKR
jgi:hypothetical protein